MKSVTLSKKLVLAAMASTLLTPSLNASASVSSTMGWDQGPTEKAYQNSIWAPMSQDFKLQHYTYRAEVQNRIKYLVTHKQDLYRAFQKAAPYIRYIYEQTQAHGLPAELALLPMVESNFDPNAKSPVGALGLWQLMPATASGLGVKNNASYDGRRDVYASTNAALKFLKYLNNYFKNDWILAIAAYNCGPGNINKAVKKNGSVLKGASFWNLASLPKETKDYIPKLLALAAIVQDPGKYGLVLPSLNDAPKLAAVQVGAKVDLKKVANSAGMTEQTMRTLNPGYHKMATAAGAPNTLLVPAEKVPHVQAVLASATVVKTAPVKAAPAKVAQVKTQDVVVKPVQDVVVAPAQYADAAPAPSVSKFEKSLMDAILTPGKLFTLATADQRITHMNPYVFSVETDV